MRSLLDSGAIARNPEGGWHVTSVRIPDLPSTVNGVVAARFDRLHDAHRTLLQEASVIGRQFTVTLMSKPAGQAAIERALGDLVEAEFVRARSGEEYLFYLALTHEVVYNSLLLSARRELHRGIGERIEEALQNRPPDNPRTLARHFQRGEVPAKALRYLYLSGQQAHRNFANEEALRCFTDCLTLIETAPADPASPSQVDILLALAEILATTGKYDVALQHLETALGLQTISAARAETLRRMGSVLNLQGKYAEAMERYEEGLQALAGDLDRLCLARIRQDQGLSLFRQGRYSEVIALCEESLGLLAGSEHLAEIAMAESILGLVAYRQNRQDDAEGYHRRALERREAIEDLFGIASSLNNLGVLYREDGEWAKASEYYLRSLQIYRQIGDISRQIIQLLNLSDLYRTQGELELAYEHYKQVRDLSEQTQDAFGMAYGALGLGMVLLDAGRFPEAQAQIDEGTRRFETINAREVLPEAFVAQARCHLHEGRLNEASSALERARDSARENSSRRQLGMAFSIEAVMELQRGGVERARQVSAEAVQELREGGSLIDLGRGLAIEATVLNAAGLHEVARERRTEAEAIFKRLGAVLDLRNLQLIPTDA
ncbi:photosystem I assembly protein Ycf3 [compost metagenome]